MIFISFNQLQILFIFIFLGLFFGLVFNIIKTIFLLNFSKNIKKTLILSVFYTIFSCFYIIFINIFNFGILNIILLLAYIFGFLWSKKLLVNLVVFYENKWYNVITKVKAKRKDKHANKSKKV